MKLLPLPIYAGLSADEQLRVFESPPANTRKVIVATNIAETSITISGIVYVIDCGFVKLRAYNPRSGREALVVTPISQSSANQRAGRAGRIKPGKCYRLYSEKAYQEDLPKFTPPEIQRTNLASVVLQLKAMGIDNIMGFEFLSPPPPEMMMRALELLYALGALDDSCKLTSVVGAQTAEFPTDPMLTRMLLASVEFKCAEEVLSIAAMLSVQSVWTAKEFRGRPDVQRKKLGAKEGDHLTLLNVYNSFRALKADQVHAWCQQNYISHRALSRALEIRKQLYKYLRKFDHAVLSSDDSVVIRKAIVAGFFANAAQLSADGSYRTVRDDKPLHLHPSSILFKEKPPEWLIFHEVVETSKEFMREVTIIEPVWLYEIAPHYYNWNGPPPPSAGAGSKPAPAAATVDRPNKQART